MFMTLALAGNPNAGKTTLFNALTGSNQYVGNWPGVTVEKKEGAMKFHGESVRIVDLPGIYSLSPYSMEEIVTRDYITREHPDAIIDIVDGTNIERNLYLTLQLMELGIPVVVAVNMMDEVLKRGDSIDCDMLSRNLGAPALPIVARNGENVMEVVEHSHRLLHAAIAQHHVVEHHGWEMRAAPEHEALEHKLIEEDPYAARLLAYEPPDVMARYDEHTLAAVKKIAERIHHAAHRAHLPVRWAAIKLLEGDAPIGKHLRLSHADIDYIEDVAREYEATSPYGDRETMVADCRYRLVAQIVKGAVTHALKPGEMTLSDKIDRVVTNRVLAIPIFLLMMFVVFAITFGPPGTFLKDGMETALGWLSEGATAGLSLLGAAPWVISLVVDGIIGGVGGVITFLPQIALLFLFLSLLEDSGYMARAAFIMDKLLRKLGLSGKSFIPMLMGFGCTVPAVMAARTMESEKDRRMTILLTPFMSCGARLPVYALMAGAFFPGNEMVVVFSMYVLGMVVAVLSGLVLRKTLFRGDAASFVLELPPYRMPGLATIALHVWDRVRGFLVRAGTLIFAMSVAIWFLQTFNFRMQAVTDNADSMFAWLGRLIAPLLRPLGFGTWQAAVSLLSGFIAKESIVATMTLLYGAGSLGVTQALQGAFTPLSAYAFLAFVLLYMPCIAAFAAIRREMNSRKWTAIALLWGIGCAYIVALIIYQVGGLWV